MENSRTALRFQSLFATMFPTLRCTKTSPALVCVMVFTGTRESEQPIQSTVGFWSLARVMKNSFSFSNVSDTNRLFPSKRVVIMAPRSPPQRL